MSRPSCSVDPCARASYVRGLCIGHYRNGLRSGELPLQRIRSRWPDSLVVHSQRPSGTDGCWLWTGSTNGIKGYGIVKTPDGKKLAHRASYEHHVGPIPDGLVLDHLCRTPLCINPTHLEPVTMAENIRRGRASYFGGVCLSGRHDVTTPGALILAGDGSRRCAECRRASQDAMHARQRERRVAS